MTEHVARQLRLSLGLYAGLSLPACADAPACPGLPDDIPSSWGTVPEGLDTAAWDEAVTARMREGCIPGLSVAVVDAQGEIMSAAWGYANLDDERPVTVETPFMLASVSKAVDALALLDAEQQGLLALDEPVSDVVGFEVRNHRISLAGGAPIRLHHLATHSSGIQDNWDVLDPSYAPGDPTVPLGEFVRGYLEPKGAWFSRRKNFYPWPAGREWNYSNVGAALAAYAVEAQAGQPYASYCEARLFEPLGLTHTGWFLADFDDPDAIARPHEFDELGWTVREHYGYPTWPDGQLRTTASELGSLLRLVLGDGEVDGVRLFEPGALDPLRTAPVPGLADWFLAAFLRQQYLFWFAAELDGRALIGHDGDDYGVSTEMFYDQATGVGVVLLANISDGANGGRAREQTIAIQDRLYALGEAS